MPATVEIQDRNWRFEFQLLAKGTSHGRRYENPHVLHNLLHQYALAGLQIDSSSLPVRVRALEHFCSTFSSRSTKVLRFERELLEIQIPMGTHKASYVFTPDHASVEWTEPPDCSDDEIARILAFEVFLEQFREWMFPGLRYRREKVLGTWTLFIRFDRPGLEPWSYDLLKDFVVATRFLFDGSYDFSYVANTAIKGLAGKLHGPEWKTLITTLISHRSLIEDTVQYVALHALPMSSTVGAIAQSVVMRGMLKRCLRRDFAHCRGMIDRYALWLDTGFGNQARWGDRYEALRQMSLFLAARWPREALSDLTRRKDFHLGDDLVAASLFKRSDLAEPLRTVAAQGDSAVTGIAGIILRHVPELAVAGRGADSVASELSGSGSRFRRAKHYLVAHQADRIEGSRLAELIDGLDVVPWGHTAEVERAIKAHIPEPGTVFRFELERGVDWTAMKG